eukprot:719555-Pelagomonas_calceolata.AAC.1
MGRHAHRHGYRHRHRHAHRHGQGHRHTGHLEHLACLLAVGNCSQYAILHLKRCAFFMLQWPPAPKSEGIWHVVGPRRMWRSAFGSVFARQRPNTDDESSCMSHGKAPFA